jgi:hypothetical protein
MLQINLTQNEKGFQFLKLEIFDLVLMDFIGFIEKFIREFKKE